MGYTFLELEDLHVIGASLSEPHTSEKDVCGCPSAEIYDQMWKMVNSRSNTKQTNIKSVLGSHRN